MGFHLWYGDQSPKHFKDPEDKSVLATLIREILNDPTGMLIGSTCLSHRSVYILDISSPLKSSWDLEGKVNYAVLGLIHGYNLDGTPEQS
jgi:hypothetical protein